jgi:hypothetical protein
VVAHNQLEIPKRLQDAVDHPRLFALDAAFEKDQQIDIRMEAQRAPTVAAERADDERLRRVNASGVDELPHDSVHLGGIPRLCVTAAAARFSRRRKVAARTPELFREPGSLAARPDRGRIDLPITGCSRTNDVCVSR